MKVKFKGLYGAKSALSPLSREEPRVFAQSSQFHFCDCIGYIKRFGGETKQTYFNRWKLPDLGIGMARLEDVLL